MRGAAAMQQVADWLEKLGRQGAVALDAVAVFKER